jgi:thiamine pyrophosphokinase
VFDLLIHILAGGPVEFVPDLFSYHEAEAIWVGVDRGVVTLLKAGIIPVKAFGDFDSITEAELEWVRTRLSEVEIWPSEKDQTDMDIAIDWALAQKPDKIRIFGATGGRLDHLFGNVQLLIKNVKTNIEIIDRQNIITAHEPGEYMIENNPAFRYISFIPVTLDVKGITLKGFKYPLTNCHIQLGSTLCISNELIQSCGTFSFSEGILMMVRSKDLGDGF